jgi:hypothetical protein
MELIDGNEVENVAEQEDAKWRKETVPGSVQVLDGQLAGANKQ